MISLLLPSFDLSYRILRGQPDGFLPQIGPARINTGSESGTAMQTENGSILDQTITTIGTILGSELDQITIEQRW